MTTRLPWHFVSRLFILAPRLNHTWDLCIITTYGGEVGREILRTVGWALIKTPFIPFFFVAGFLCTYVGGGGRLWPGRLPVGLYSTPFLVGVFTTLPVPRLRSGPWSAVHTIEM